MKAVCDVASLASWLDQKPEALLVTDPAGVIVHVNPAFEMLTGFARAETLGARPSILKSGVHGEAFYRRLWRSLLAGKPFRAVFVNRRKSGELYRAENLIWPVRDAGGRIHSFVCETRDVTAREREREKLAHAATHDPLTDLPNRALFLDRLALALSHAARRGEVLALAILDIDRFRDVNSRHGHLAGDAVLQTVARRTASCVREGDTVARVGGDELALILPGAGACNGAEAVFEKVRSTNAAPIRWEGRRLRVGVSIGVAEFPRDAADAEALRKHADSAMYAAKRAGGNCVRYHRARRGRIFEQTSLAVSA